jgi:hypothetical protein
MAKKRTHGLEHWVFNSRYSSVTVYAAGANGNVAPIQKIKGPRTGLDFPWDVAIDDACNIYVGNVGSPGGGEGRVTVYAAGANGDAAPIQSITGSNTGLVTASGIAVDSDRNIYVLSTGSAAMLVFAAGANGNVAPIQTIAGEKTRLRFPEGIAFR